MAKPVEIKIDLQQLFTVPGATEEMIGKVIQAGMFIIENEYVDQAPGNIGDFKQGIQVKKRSTLEYVVESTAERDNVDYPLILFEGTGKLKGLPDYGFTTGHVRAGTVAWGIGGIRPNKVADRAKSRSERDFQSYVRRMLSSAIKKHK